MINTSRLIKNSISNIVNGFATSLMSVAITPFLYEILTKDEFSIWSVTIQLGILINVAATSLQVSVGRFVSYRSNSLSKSINSMFRFQQLAFCLILLSTLFISLLSINYGWLIQNYQAITGTLPNASWSISIVCFSYMLNIFGGYFTGVFIGKERNEIPALVNVVFKCILGLLLVYVARCGLLIMSVIFFIVNAFSYAVLFYLSPRYIKFIVVKYTHQIIASFPSVKNEEWRYYYGIYVLNFSMFLVSGVGSIIISKYDFNSVANYSVAIGFVNLIVGGISTILAPLIQPLTVAHRDGESKKISKVFTYLTCALCAMILLFVVLSTFISRQFFSLWINAENGLEISNIFNFLLVAYLVRLVGVPFNLILLAKGLQNKLIAMPLLEGGINFCLGLILVSLYGWVGIYVSVSCSVVIVLLIYMRNVKSLLGIEIGAFTILGFYFLFPALLLLLYPLFSIGLSSDM
ncbi:hypothetical protein ACK3Z6_10705 [Aeromonas caviae]|uniref:hypothetical protein n=1 Tax=Aeromonas caviae TaxID=648 RepID=UPI00208EBD22|nr:hypothetical protein [Aeromonas caviae]MDX7648985.1 hypothetical protein [Aeromonas caviae]USP61113.1 hypothetical protein J6625_14155 [Aeromonas caviae]